MLKKSKIINRINRLLILTMASLFIGGGTALASDDDLVFPIVIYQYLQGTAFQREAFLESILGEDLSGWGDVRSVDNCDYSDRSQRHGRSCLKVVLGQSNDSVTLYYPQSQRAELGNIRFNQRIRFSHCKITHLVTHGRGSTIGCDMTRF